MNKFYLGIFLCLTTELACKKNGSNQLPPCPNYNTVDHELPEKMNVWFPKTPAVPYPGMNVRSYSNTGLSESMSIKYYRGYFTNSKEGSCDPTDLYYIHQYTYSSSLYGFGFDLYKGYFTSP